MNSPGHDVSWDDHAAAVRAALQQWRATHPRATLKEIEQEVDRQLAAVRAGLVGTLAEAGPVADLPPPCPDCGTAMRWDGERTRRLTTTHDETLTLTRRYARCPECGAGVFPPG